MQRGRYSRYSKRANIEQFLQSTAPSSLTIQDVIVELVKIYDINIVKLKSRNPVCI